MSWWDCRKQCWQMSANGKVGISSKADEVFQVMADCIVSTFCVNSFVRSLWVLRLMNFVVPGSRGYGLQQHYNEMALESLWSHQQFNQKWNCMGGGFIDGVLMPDVAEQVRQCAVSDFQFCTR